MKTIWKYELQPGHQVPDDPGTYVVTFQYPGELVFHVFMEEGCDPE